MEKNLNVSVWGYDNKVKKISFSDKRSDSDSTKITVNYKAYLSYITENYPDLYEFNLKSEFEIELQEKDNDEKENLVKEFNKNVKSDYTLLNKLDIEHYKGLNSPDDIFDSLANSVYNMGFIGKYSRIASAIENGINYIFSFEDFAHIYPFLKAHQGDALLTRKLKKLPYHDQKRYDSYKLHYEKSLENIIGPVTKYYHNIKDLYFQKRSSFNNTLVLKPEYMNPPGSEWSYLSIDKENVKIGNSYRYKYLTKFNETIRNDTTNENEINKNINFNKFDKFDGGRYIFEKYLYCTSKWCCGSMKIILDCIHNVVIISTINPHYDCLDSQKRQIYDIVRKLFVINNGDLDKIDATYLSIPRRYGLTYVESWINFDEFESFRTNEFTPSFFKYKINQSDYGKSWASRKNRNWIIDTFYKLNNFKTDDLLFFKSDKNVSKYIRTRINYQQNPQLSYDLLNYGISHWNLDIYRYDLFGNVIKRDEWEYHIDQNCDGKLKEIYRIWRWKYFGITDFLRNNTFSLPMSKNLKFIEYFIQHEGDNKINPSLVHLFRFNVTMNNYEDYKRKQILQEIFMIINDNKRFDLCEFEEILFKNKNQLKILPNPGSFVLQYPLNKQIVTMINSKNIFKKLKDEMGCIFICSSMDELINCDKLIISERDIKYQNPGRSSYKAMYYRKNNIHLSDQIWSMHPNFEEAFTMMTIYDEDFLNCRYIKERFYDLLNDDGKEKGILMNNFFKSSDKMSHIDRMDYFNGFRMPNRNENRDKTEYKGFRIIWEVNNEIKNGFLLCNLRNLRDVVKLISSKRNKRGKFKVVIFAEYINNETNCLNNNNNDDDGDDEKYDIIQIQEIQFKKLKKMMPYNVLLLIMYSIINIDYDLLDIINILKTRLPPQRSSDTTFFKIEYEGKRIASNAGLVRYEVNKLINIINYLRTLNKFWRIDKNDIKFTCNELLEGMPYNFNQNYLTNLSDIFNAKYNLNNIKIAKNKEYVDLFKWGIDTVLSDELENNYEELIKGEFRDIYELIKCCIDYI